jgi:uncharacterized coiled-coil protein SlyX
MKHGMDQETRIANLEAAVAHHQRDYDTLNQVVTEYADQIDNLKRIVGQLTERIRAMEQQQRQAAPLDLQDERPPHY